MPVGMGAPSALQTSRTLARIFASRKTFADEEGRDIVCDIESEEYGRKY